jgi:hypothetical protein
LFSFYIAHVKTADQRHRYPTTPGAPDVSQENVYISASYDDSSGQVDTALMMEQFGFGIHPTESSCGSLQGSRMMFGMFDFHPTVNQ